MSYQFKEVNVKTFIGRQPIFDRNGNTFAYELLYRSCDTFNAATFDNNTKATARVIANLIHNLGVENIIGQKMGFINVDENILFSDAILLLPKEFFWFEILESTKVTLALVERIKHLHALGYRFLLDDFNCTDITIKTYEPLFAYVDIIKVDILAIGLPNLALALSKIEKYAIPLLAEKIESYLEYQTCAQFSFVYFQGYFFEHPLILSGKKIEPNTLSAIRIMNCIRNTDDTKEISQKFSMCPDLVYNLLRHINSGAYHFKQSITNIGQMISLLGPQKLLSWLGLFLYGNPSSKPFGEELFNSAKFRAKCMELLAQSCDTPSLASKAFLTGSLSLVDAYLDIPMETFLDEVHLDEEITKALLHHEGILGELLLIAKEMSHSTDIEKSIIVTEHSSLFDKETLYHACFEANLFVEETNQSRKESL